jgi:hypothetical protein
MPDALIPRRREVVAPGELEHPRPQLGCQVTSAVGGAGIDDNGFINEVRGGLQTGRQLWFFVAHH